MRKNKKVKTSLAKKEAGKAWLFLLPSILGITVFVLLPFMDVIRRSFYDAMGKRFVGPANYKLLLNNEAIRLAVGNTGRFILICIPLLLLLSLLLSLLLQNQHSHREFLKTSFLLPMAIPVASVVLLWRLLFHGNGLINGFLVHIGAQKIDFMNTDKALAVLIITYLWKNIGYDMILWLTGLNGISVSLYEAAAVDGAGKWAKFRFITFPQLVPTIFVIGILSFVNSFKVFREAYLISGNYPDDSIYMLQHLFNNWFISMDIHKMTAAAVLCIIIFVLLIIVFKKFIKDEE